MNRLAVDALAEACREIDPEELPLFGKVWTLQVEDDDLVLRMAKKVNGTKVPRHAPGENPPPAQPKPEVHPKPQSPPKEDQ